MTLDPAATRRAAAKTDRGLSFGTVRLRGLAPEVEPELVAFVAGGGAGHAQQRRVLDLGAGTGQLGEALVDAEPRGS